MFRKSLIVLATILAAACGSTGPAGPVGPGGPTGPTGPSGDAGTPGASPCATGGVTAAVAVSSPPTSGFFTTGGQPVLTITFTDSCGNQLAPSSLSQASLYVYGPRDPLKTVTDTQMMNSPSGVFTAEQNLISPVNSTGDAGVPNYKLNSDNSITYTLSPVTTEAAGTYTAGVWALAGDPIGQSFALGDFQIGTATPESYIPGPADSSTCLNCHKNFAPGGKVYMAHIAPGFSPVGNYALDSLPIGSCKSCHNNNGYSPNTIMRKVHGAHRGAHQLAPGAAHPEYGEGQDDSLAGYLNVHFPSMPTGGTPGFTLTSDLAMEKNCTSCHTSTVYQTNLSRAACGTCHDNVFFAGAILPDGGITPGATEAAITPPTVIGPPTGLPACTLTAQCASVSSIATCNTTTGNCELTYHQLQLDDSQCTTCHAVGSVIAPVDVAHNIAQWQPTPADGGASLDGYTFKTVTVTGGGGPNGSFRVGDTPTLSFQLFDPTGATVADLVTNAAWSGTFIVAGPTSNPQRVYGSASGGLSMKTAGTFTYTAASQTYTYVPPAGGWPANALEPIDGDAGVQANPIGSYTVWFYLAHSSPAGLRDGIDAQAIVAFGADQPKQARQVVTQAGCASCHGAFPDGFPHLALHGGPRKDGETCSACHSQWAQDLGANSAGVACTTNAQCGGYDVANPAASWETCQTGVCTTTVDPTPGVYIDYQQLVHNIHFARKRAGYEETNNLGAPWQSPPIAPATLNYLGHNNGLSDFQEVLSPVDVRSCTNCHQDAKNTCAVNTDCAYGQTCGTAGTCVNVAWQNPTARACITCHDTGPAAAHAALNTTSSGVESCNVCHGSGAAFAVDTVHNITSLYPIHLAYPRE